MTTNTNTPVLFITFNRPTSALKVLQVIREARPSRLYISSDGPRQNVTGEERLVSSLRSEILESVDWQCEVRTLFHLENQGCKHAPQKAITWFFKQEESGIILEDDCLPSGSFYRYASELLERYKDDYRIFGISGSNFQAKKFPISTSYYYSNFFITWGWATWRSRWETHLAILKDYANYLNHPKVFHLIKNKAANKALISYASKSYSGQLDAWDYQWILTCMMQRGLIVTPAKNLIENIGFGKNATHTTSAQNRDVLAEILEFPLQHPKLIRPEEAIDNSFYKNIQGWLSTREKIMNRKYIQALLRARLGSLI